MSVLYFFVVGIFFAKIYQDTKMYCLILPLKEVCYFVYWRSASNWSLSPPKRKCMKVGELFFLKYSGFDKQF